MGSRIHRPSPSMAVALTALVFAMGGSGYAATELAHNGDRAKAAKKKVKRGPAGPQGAQGLAGMQGGPGARGPAGPSVFFGHLDVLNTDGDNAFGSPVGYSIVDGTETTRSALSPDIPLTVTDFTVRLSAPPGDGSERFFYILANGVPVGGTSGGCDISDTDTICATAPSGTIPARSRLSIESLNGISNTAPASAEFSWTATSP
jgi:hypothetical protein